MAQICRPKLPSILNTSNAISSISFLPLKKGKRFMLMKFFESSNLQSKLSKQLLIFFSRFNLVQKSEAEFIKKVKMKFGEPEDVSILLGDWSGAHKKFQAPSKVRGFINMYKRAGYGVYLVDEHLTSSVCPHCQARSLETFKSRPSPRPWRRALGHLQTVHGLLRCTTANCQPIVNGQGVRRVWNRDDVATLNIRAVVYETIASVSVANPQGVRPLRFS